MSNKECCATDVLSVMLCKIGMNRSMLITLALIPFAWDGITWGVDAIRELWNLIATV